MISLPDKGNYAWVEERDIEGKRCNSSVSRICLCYEIIGNKVSLSVFTKIRCIICMYMYSLCSAVTSILVVIWFMFGVWKPSEFESELILRISIHMQMQINNSSLRHLQDSLLLGNGNSGLEDIKQAIEQLTLRSYHSGSSSGHGVLGDGIKGHHGGRADHHSSYSTSTYSSMSGSECDRHRRPHHLIRHSSLETINTQVSSE
jgi:hypothetical protein